MIERSNSEMINMGSAHDIMQIFAYKEIRTHFKECDGWEYQAGSVTLRT